MHEAGQKVLQSLDAADDLDDLFVATEELLMVLLQHFRLEARQLREASTEFGFTKFTLVGGPLGASRSRPCISCWKGPISTFWRRTQCQARGWRKKWKDRADEALHLDSTFWTCNGSSRCMYVNVPCGTDNCPDAVARRGPFFSESAHGKSPRVEDLQKMLDQQGWNRIGDQHAADANRMDRLLRYGRSGAVGVGWDHDVFETGRTAARGPRPSAVPAVDSRTAGPTSPNGEGKGERLKIASGIARATS